MQTVYFELAAPPPPSATGRTPFGGGSLKPVVGPVFGAVVFGGFVARFADVTTFADGVAIPGVFELVPGGVFV